MLARLSSAALIVSLLLAGCSLKALWALAWGIWLLESGYNVYVLTQHP